MDHGPLIEGGAHAYSVAHEEWCATEFFLSVAHGVPCATESLYSVAHVLMMRHRMFKFQWRIYSHAPQNNFLWRMD